MVLTVGVMVIGVPDGEVEFGGEHLKACFHREDEDFLIDGRVLEE